MVGILSRFLLGPGLFSGAMLLLVFGRVDVIQLGSHDLPITFSHHPQVGDKPHQDGADTRPKHDRDQGDFRLPTAKMVCWNRFLVSDLAFGRF